MKDGRDLRDVKPVTVDVKEPRENRDARDSRETKDAHEHREPRESRDRLSRQQNGSQPSAAIASQERSARWDKRIKTEESYDDIKRDNERLEKEIWLEIAGLHTIKLDY